MAEPTIVDDYTGILAYKTADHLRWNALTDLGASIVVTYSFTETVDLPPLEGHAYYGTTSFQTFTEFQRSQMRTVLDKMETISGVMFVEVDGPAMIDMYSGLGSTSTSGYASYGFGTDYQTNNSDLVMVYQDFSDNSFTYGVLLHELGHAMGLQHSHDGDFVLTPAADTQKNTVMTYNNTRPYATDYGLFDGQALTHLYGTSSKEKGWVKSVDANGVITIDLHHADDHFVSTDKGAKILGRGGDDLLIGRLGADMFFGNAGADTLRGGLGDDRLMGGPGDDHLIGDTGLAYRGDNDILSGQSGNDIIEGNGGDDRLFGQNGSDTLFGQNGNDVLIGGADDDILNGGDGDDILVGGTGADAFVFGQEHYRDFDRIRDFEIGIDVIDFRELGITFDYLTLVQKGTHTQVMIGGFDHRLVVMNTLADDLSVDDFRFDLSA